MTKKIFLFVAAIILIAIAVASVAVIVYKACIGYDMTEGYKAKYFASLVERLYEVNSKSDFSHASEVIAELRNGLRRGIVSTEEIQAKLPGHMLGLNWVKILELSIKECQVDAKLEELESLSKKEIHEEGDYAKASALSEEATRLYQEMAYSKLLIPRFALNKAEMDRQVERTRVTKVTGSTSSKKRQ